LAILMIAFVMFNLGWIGGGDAKLAAATAAWLGWAAILDYGLAAALFGGILTLIILGARTAPLPAVFGRIDWLARLHNANAGVPYGIALAAAGFSPVTRVGSFRRASTARIHSFRSFLGRWAIFVLRRRRAPIKNSAYNCGRLIELFALIPSIETPVAKVVMALS
jgi:hypothetical protein